MKRLCVIMTVVMLLLFASMPISVFAEENENKAIVTIDDLTVDKTNASFSFIVNVETDEAYAGAEFGAFCSQGVEITSVESSCDSLAGPTQANGLVWFSFFDGENSFNGKQSVTVYGSYEVGQESAIRFSDIKIYSINANKYITTTVEGDVDVQISKGVQKTTGVVKENDMNILLLLALVLVIVVTTVVMFIYIKKNKVKKGETDKNVQKSI
ncbi:MAG: hypothetical protein UHK60_05735 [Acutalibacteraceae bacterium]|nr:hypothetical protein [Acutalibacteraceae bacterium]